MNHLDTVRHIYDAFGRGDVPAILDHFADDVEWEYGLNSTDVPWLQPHRGKAEAAQFFQSLSNLTIHRFEPKALMGEGDVVVALIDVEATVKTTGRPFVEEDETHIWYFDDAGKVARFRHRVDTHQHAQAWRGAGVSA